jgi:hypothetical protein
MDDSNWVGETIPTDIAESELLRFNVTLPNKKVMAIDMLACTELDYNMLEEQMADISSQFSFFAAVYSQLKYQCTIREKALKAKRGRLFDTFLKTAAAQTTRPPAADTLKIIVEGDKGLINLEQELAGIQRDTGKVWYLVEALRMKADMLRSLAGFKRQEKFES